MYVCHSVRVEVRGWLCAMYACLSCLHGFLGSRSLGLYSLRYLPCAKAAYYYTFFFKDLKVLWVCVCVSVYICHCGEHICGGPEEDAGSPGAGYSSCKPPDLRCWKVSLGPWESSKRSLHPWVIAPAGHYLFFSLIVSIPSFMSLLFKNSL